MIIYGSQTIESAASAGTFSCPRCQTPQGCRRIIHRRWFTLYFIPVIPLGRLGEQFECQGCFSRFSREALAGGQSSEPVTAILVDEQGALAHTSAPRMQELPKTSPLAVTSLILGLLSPVLSLCFCGLLSLFSSAGAIIAGHVALLNIKRSAVPLAGRGMAAAGLVLGYPLFIISIGWWVMIAGVLYDGRQDARRPPAQQRSRLAQTAEDRLASAELRVTTRGNHGGISGNSPEATRLARGYAEALQQMRDATFTDDRDRIFTLTGGQFLVHCERRPGRCAFIVHVPSYRHFDNDAKELLEINAWQLARQTVKGTLSPGDSLAVGLRGVAIYGAVLVGTAGPDESDAGAFTRADRDALLAFFPDDGGPGAPPSTAVPPLEAPLASGPALVPGVPAESPEFPSAADPGPSGAIPPAFDRGSPPPRPIVVDAAERDAALPPAEEAPSPPAAPRSRRPEKTAPPAEVGRLADVVHRFPDMGWTVQSLAFAPNGRYLAAGKLDSTLLLLDAHTGQRLQSETNRNDLGPIACVAFSFDGGKLFAGGHRGTIQVWNVDHAGRPREAGSIRGHARPVTCLVTSPAARFVLSGSAAGELIWQAYDKPSQESRALAAFERPVLAVHLPQGGMAAWATDGRRLIQFDLRNAHITKTYELGRLTARAAAFSSDGGQLAMSLGRSIGLWDTQTGTEIMTLPAFGESHWSVAFLPDGGGLVSGGRGKATLWRLADGQPVAGVDLGGVLYIKALAVTKDGTLLAAIPSSAGQTLTIARLPDPGPVVDP